MKFLIVSGGSIDRNFAEKYIRKNSFDKILAADSGLNFLYEKKIIPDIIVGDFDSVDENVLKFFKEQRSIDFQILNPIKDDTDTEHAIRYAIDSGASEITIIGGTGTRLDHVLGNIALLGIGFDAGVSIIIVDPNNRITMRNSSFSIEKSKQYGKYLSLIPFGGDVYALTLKGMKYNLDNFQMGGYNSLGISNEIVEEVAQVSFEKGVLIVIESKDE